MVCKGFMEHAGEYGCVWAPVTRHETCRMFFCRAAREHLKMRSIDVCSAFLTAPLQRPVYMKAPEGHEREGYVCRVRQACYGLCDAPRAFYTDFRQFLKTRKIEPTDQDPCLYKSSNPSYPSVWILQYVDDLQIQGTDADISAFVADLQSKYKIRDYGEPRSFIGMEIARTEHTITLTQSEYIRQMAARFGLLDSNYVSTPMDSSSLLSAQDDADTKPDATLYRSMVGSLMYAQCLTMPGLSFPVMSLSRYLANPTHAHVNAAKRAIAWAFHHRHIGITYDARIAPDLTMYSDANWACCLDTRRSTSGRISMLCGGGDILGLPYAAHGGDQQRRIGICCCVGLLC